MDDAVTEMKIDVAVIGSGAAGFAAALTAKTHGLDVHIFEKAEVFGGTSAISGGVAWVPGNHLMEGASTDSAEDVLRYLRPHVGNRSNDALLQSFATQAPRMLAFLTENRFLRVGRMEGFPDYQAETPGGDAAPNGGGRSVEPLVFSGAKLGDWLPKLRHRPSKLPVVGTMSELRRLAAVKTDFWEFLQGWRAIPRTFWGRLTGANHLASGAALIGWLAHAAKSLGIPLHLSTPLESLVVESDRVQGLVATRGEQTMRVAVRKGVILASGGFDHNGALREAHLARGAAQGYSVGVPSNTGDGQLAAQASGSALANMDSAWGAPVCLVPGSGPQIVIFERGKPGQVIVDANGERFANEAQPYGDFVRAMLEANAASNAAIPAFMIFDQTFRDRYPMGPLLPGVTPESAIDNGFLTRTDSLELLAEALDINASGLVQTVNRFNEMAAAGVDADFQRGEFAFDRYGGDRSVSPNPCMGPITRPPFYAVKLYPGDLGTNGGVHTNEHAQALNSAGQPIEGLYAAGNCAASALGGFYPGAGGTIGPAMTFAYIAARHLAGEALAD